MKRPCKHPYCPKTLGEDAPRNKEFCSPNCNRDFNRMKADGDFAFMRATEAFYGGLRCIRRLAPGQIVKGGRNRRVACEAVIA